MERVFGLTGPSVAPGDVRLQGVATPRFLPRPESKEKPVHAGGFREALAQAFAQVDEAQRRAEAAAIQLAAGEDVDLHHVMLANERAALSLELTVAIQNKLVEAYREISRMQV